MHRCSNYPGTDALLELLDKLLGKLDAKEPFHYSQWETIDRASLLTVPPTFEEYKKTLIRAINSLTKHSFLAK